MRIPFLSSPPKPEAPIKVDPRLEALTLGWLRDPDLVRHLLSDDAFFCFRSLDNELLLALGQREFEVLLTSTNAGDGRSTIAMVLATLSAAYSSDQSVLYVDASDDFRHSQRLFNTPPERLGLYDYLEGTAEVDQVFQATPLNNLQVVTCSAAKEGRRMFDPKRFENFLAEARKRFQRIIIDAPPLETHREALPMARVVGNTLLVLRCRHTPRARATLAMRDLQGVGAKVIGSVLNDRVYPIPGTRPGS